LNNLKNFELNNKPNENSKNIFSFKNNN